MDVVRICSDLVRIRSENPPGDTRDAIEYIRSRIESFGIPSVVTEIKRGRCNLVTRKTGSGLLFCGHVDVVPALDDGWSVPPFSGAVLDGSVWGRGATDMKGGCAAILAACHAYIASDKELPVQLAFVCDEETGGTAGIRHLAAQKYITPCDCLIAEPTPVRHPNIGQKGLVRLEMRFTGTPAHGSLYPSVGVSAIMEALSLLSYLKQQNRKKFPISRDLRGIVKRSSQVLGKEFGMDHLSDVLTSLMFNPGVIKGGEKSNIVAQRCDLDLELRVPWGCRIDELLDGIQRHTPHGTVLTRTTHEPSITEPGCRLVAVTCDAIRHVRGGDVFPIVQWAASDARHLRGTGFRVIEYGPGNLQYLHAINEHVGTEMLEKASLVYQEILRIYSAQ